MASTKAISVELGAQQASLQRHLESGHYGDASEVIRDALRALDQRDAVFDEVLRAQVLASMANKRPGVPAADVFKPLEVRHVRRTKAAKRGDKSPQKQDIARAKNMARELKEMKP